MPRWLNVLIQVVGIVGQGFNAFGGFVPPKYQVQVAGGIGAAQAAVGVLAHSFNPDGTNASVGYVPKN